jgi:hypothetical protein
VLYVSCGGGLGRPAGSRDRAAVRERLARLNVPVTMAADIPEAFERLAERRSPCACSTSARAARPSPPFASFAPSIPILS